MLEQKQTEFGGITENKNKKQLEQMVKYLNDVTGLNLELEGRLSIQDGKTMKYEVVKRSPGIIETYSDFLPAKQLVKELNRMYIFATQLRAERLLVKGDNA